MKDWLESIQISSNFKEYWKLYSSLSGSLEIGIKLWHQQIAFVFYAAPRPNPARCRYAEDL